MTKFKPSVVAFSTVLRKVTPTCQSLTQHRLSISMKVNTKTALPPKLMNDIPVFKSLLVREYFKIKEQNHPTSKTRDGYLTNL